jgi:hypothetical protein
MVTRIGELGTTLKNGIFWDVSEDTILHSHRHENLKSYIGTTLAVTSQKTLFFIVTAANTSNLTNMFSCSIYPTKCLC